MSAQHHGENAITFGKQREPLRITGPARAFPATDVQTADTGGQGSTNSDHNTNGPRLINADTVFLENLVDGGASTTNLPTSQAILADATPVYVLVAPNMAYSSIGSTVTITAAGYVAGNPIKVKFSTGGLSTGGLFDATYTITTATATNFTITLPSSPANTSGNCYFPTTTVTITAPGYQAGDTVNIQFTSGTLGSNAPYNTSPTP